MTVGVLKRQCGGFPFPPHFWERAGTVAHFFFADSMRMVPPPAPPHHVRPQQKKVIQHTPRDNRLVSKQRTKQKIREKK